MIARAEGGVVRFVLFSGLCAAWLAGLPVAAEEPDAETRAGWQKLAAAGEGFVVWESNRSGHWRLWRRDLDGSGLRQISRDEQDREHYCPHLSPDGTRL